MPLIPVLTSQSYLNNNYSRELLQPICNSVAALLLENHISPECVACMKRTRCTYPSTLLALTATTVSINASHLLCNTLVAHYCI